MPVEATLDLVRARGSLWTVHGRTRYAACQSAALRGAGVENAGELRTLLSPFDRIAPAVRRASWRTVRPRRWLHLLRRQAIDADPFGSLRAVDECRIDLLPYQLEPAIAVVRDGAARLLIADEVGLGKTIQAGVILRELAASHDALRALVVVPAGLREQWHGELGDRFDLRVAVADAGWLFERARELPPDVNPWSLPGIFLASHDFVKRPEVLRPLEDVTWDLAVFDEAHAATPGTDRLAAAEAIARRARRIVLLTATPHSGDAAQFDALCHIGGAVDDEPLVVFRRSRHQVLPGPARRTAILCVRPAAAERRMHRLLERYAAQICREGGRIDPRVRLAAIVLRKRALSSAGSLLTSAARRQELLTLGIEPSGVQLSLPLGEEDPLPDDVGDAALAAPGLADAGREQRVLGAIVHAAGLAAGGETKIAFLIRLLRRIHEPAIVFTEYRDTLSRLAADLRREGFRPLALHGGLSLDDRAEVQRAFNTEGGLLLATDAAAEGLNLHHCCRTVVHFELPWSPLRLQQRTGRVDRLGQTRRVHEILLVASDTAERLVLAPLARRMAASRAFCSIAESRVIDAILAGAAIPVNSDTQRSEWAGPTANVREAAAMEAARLTVRREWRAASAPARPDRFRERLPASRLKGSSERLLQGRSILVFRLTLRDGCGRAVHAELLPVAADGSLTADEVRLALEPTLAGRIHNVSALQQTLVARARRRERAMAADRPDAARQLVQAGLFDRRALAAADGVRAAAAAIRRETCQRLSALDLASRLSVSLTLVATLEVGAGRP